MTPNTEVRCPKCNTLFGIESTDEAPNGYQNQVLTIKHRDLYRTINGEVWGPCRRCGSVVMWPEKALG